MQGTFRAARNPIDAIAFLSDRGVLSEYGMQSAGAASANVLRPKNQTLIFVPSSFNNFDGQ